MAFLGIDTSNYRTSICLIDEQYRQIAEYNPLLNVKKGEVGLQQSMAVFEHIKQWPKIIQHIPYENNIKAVAVSTTPTPATDSYMPVFKVGQAFAETIAHFLNVPLYTTSHQEGHIAAGIYSLSEPFPKTPFMAVHLSGGTSEILKCTPASNGNYNIEKIGGTLDLHAGQFIDRVGVTLGLPFPAGPHLEKLAQQWASRLTIHKDDNVHKYLPTIPSYVKGSLFSFSGPTSAALRLIEKNTYEAGQIARTVEKTLAKTIEKALVNATKETHIKHVLIVGGVAANRYIRQYLMKRLEHRAVGLKLYFAKPSYSTDNAFGVACIGQMKHTYNEKNV